MDGIVISKDFRGALTVISAPCFLSDDFLDVNFNISLTVCGITSNNFDDVKKKLMSFYGDNGALSGGCKIKDAVFSESITVDGCSFLERSRYSYNDLLDIIFKLRRPDGCPWDRAQTHETIRENAIEEAYELTEAVDLKDIEKIREESGDVLLQGLFHAVIAEESGEFTTADTVSDLCKKLIGRHTHIFGENKANNAAEALKFWEEAKAVEKKQKSAAEKIDAVPVTFTALMKANKIQKIAAKCGFDFDDALSASVKVTEELKELFEDNANAEEESGDLLFAAVNVIRLLGVNPELALLKSTDKFKSRFNFVEKKAAESGRRVNDCALAELESFYKLAKQNENR